MRRQTLVCVLVSLSLLACGKSGSGTPRGPQPPAPEVRQAQPVAIPQTALPGAGKIPLYVRVREPRRTVERIGVWTSATQPTVTAAALEQNIEAAGIPLGKFQPGANALIAIWPEWPAFKIGGILPLTEGTALENIGMQVEPLAGGGMLFGMDATGPSLKQIKAVRDDLEKIQKTAINSDIEVAVDVEGLWGVYGPLARITLPRLIGSMIETRQSMEPNQASLANVQAILGAGAAAGMGLLDQTRDAALRINFEREALDLSAVLTPKAGDGGTTLTKWLSGAPVVAPELTRYVSRNEVVSQMTVRDIKGMMDTMYGTMGMMLKPGELEELRRQFAGVEQIGTLHIANGFSMSPNEEFHGEYVMVAEHPDALMKLIREKIAIANSGPLHEFYMGLGMDVRTSSAPLTRDYKGCQVQSYAMTIEPGPNATDLDKEMMAKMFPGKLPVEIAQVGNFVLVDLGEKIDGLIDRVLAPEGRSPSRAVMTLPAGAVFYMDFNIVKYMHNVEKTMPEMPKMNLPASAPPIIMAGYHQQGRAYYVLQVPLETVSKLGQPTAEDDSTSATE